MGVGQLGFLVLLLFSSGAVGGDGWGADVPPAARRRGGCLIRLRGGARGDTGEEGGQVQTEGKEALRQEGTVGPLEKMFATGDDGFRWDTPIEDIPQYQNITPWAVERHVHGEIDEYGEEAHRSYPGSRTAGGTYILTEGGAEPILEIMDKMNERWDAAAGNINTPPEPQEAAPQGDDVETLNMRAKTSDRRESMGGGSGRGGGFAVRRAAAAAVERGGVEGGEGKGEGMGVCVDNWPDGVAGCEADIEGASSVSVNRVLGFAVIYFGNREDAMKAMAHPPTIKGTKLSVKPFHAGGLQFGPRSACPPSEESSEDSQHVALPEGTRVVSLEAGQSAGYEPWGMKVQTRQFRVIRKEGVVDQEGRVVPVPAEDDDADILGRHVAVVHGIPPLAAKDAIIEAFAACGKILSSEIGSIAEGKRQFAVLEFADEAGLLRCLMKDGSCVEGWDEGTLRIRRRGAGKTFNDEMFQDRDKADMDEIDLLQKFKTPGSNV